MRGDVGALERMKRLERRAAKTTKTLVRKLAKTKRNQLSYKTVYAPAMNNARFSGRAQKEQHPSLKAALRRVLRKRIDKQTVFGVGEIMTEFDTVSGLLLTPMHSDASVELLADTVTKTHKAKVTLSEGRVKLFGTKDDNEGSTVEGNHEHTFLRTVALEDGLVLYYASAEPAQCNPEKPLSVSKDIYYQAQKLCAVILGAKLVTNQTSPRSVLSENKVTLTQK